MNNIQVAHSLKRQKSTPPKKKYATTQLNTPKIEQCIFDNRPLVSLAKGQIMQTIFVTP